MATKQRGTGRRPGFADEVAIYKVLKGICKSPTTFTYTSERAIGALQKDVLLSEPFQTFFRQAKTLDETWTFKPMALVRAFTLLGKDEEHVSPITNVKLNLFYHVFCFCCRPHSKDLFATKMPDLELRAWAPDMAIRLSAACRHFAQAVFRQRKWLPKEWLFMEVSDTNDTQSTQMVEEDQTEVEEEDCLVEDIAE